MTTKRYLETKRAYPAKLRRELLFRLGNKCVRCEFSDKRILQIDHINGGGNKDLEVLGYGAGYYKALLALDDDKLKSKYQLLCPNCNWIKKLERNEVCSNPIIVEPQKTTNLTDFSDDEKQAVRQFRRSQA